MDQIFLIPHRQNIPNFSQFNAWLPGARKTCMDLAVILDFHSVWYRDVLFQYRAKLKQLYFDLTGPIRGSGRGQPRGNVGPGKNTQTREDTGGDTQVHGNQTNESISRGSGKTSTSVSGRGRGRGAIISPGKDTQMSDSEPSDIGRGQEKKSEEGK